MGKLQHTIGNINKALNIIKENGFNITSDTIIIKTATARHVGYIIIDIYQNRQRFVVDISINKLLGVGHDWQQWINILDENT